MRVERFFCKVLRLKTPHVRLITSKTLTLLLLTTNIMDDQLSTPLMDSGEEGSDLPDGLRREISAVSTTSSLSSEELEST